MLKADGFLIGLIHDYIRKDPQVEHVESEVIIPSDAMHLAAPNNGAFNHQPENDITSTRHSLSRRKASQRHLGQRDNVGWNLAVLSGPAKRPSKLPVERGNLRFNPGAGRGVDIYVASSGIYTDHVDFNGRAHWFEPGIDQFQTNLPARSKYCEKSGGIGSKEQQLQDVDGLGTHVAGLAGGYKNGLAYRANIHAVKTDCGKVATTGAYTAALYDITSEHRLKKEFRTTWLTWKGSVILFPKSLPAGGHPSLQMALKHTTAAGIGVVMATTDKNEEFDHWACDFDGVVCTGSMNANYSRTTVPPSPWGKQIKVAAPGERITSCGISGKESKDVKSGGGPASGHAAGVLAMLVSQYGEDTDADKMKSKLVGLAIPNVLKEYPSGFEPRLLSTGFKSPVA